MCKDCIVSQILQEVTSAKLYLGFKMIVLPAIIAGAILPLASASGKFHGQIAAQTPKGVYVVFTIFVSSSKTSPDISNGDG